MKYFYQQGMVLFTTMVLMSLLSMLVLSLLQSVLLYMKASHQLMAKQEELTQLEAVAYQLSEINYRSECTLTMVDMNDIIPMLLNHKACIYQDKERQYTYLINDLGLYPCLPIIKDQQAFSSHHWLISVATTSTHHAILQLRVAKPAKVVNCGFTEKHPIKPGLISWRYLPASSTLEG